MGIAPLVAAKRGPQHWMMATSPAALPCGAPYSGDAGGGPIGLTVEIYLGGAGWVDISPYCYYRDRVRIQGRGRPNESTTAPPQTCTVTLNNRDGRFTPRNPLGPYYGLIGRNTPLRVSRMQNGVRRYRFYGEVVAWPTTWDISGSDVYTQITAAGPMRRMQQGNTPLQSVMRRGIPTDPHVVAYWPCEDTAGATQIAAAVGDNPMSVSGTLNAGAFSGFASSNPLPTLGADMWLGLVPSGTTGSSGRVSFFVAFPSSTSIPDQARIASIAMLGAISRVDILYRTSGPGLTLRAYDAGGTLVQDSGTLAVSLLGNTTRVTVNWDVNGSGTALSWGWFIAGGAAVGTGPYNLTQQITGVGAVRIAPDGAMSGASAGHIWVQATSSEIFYTVANQIGFGLLLWVSGYNAENPVIRLQRLCVEENLSAEVPNPQQGVLYGALNLGDRGIPTYGSLGMGPQGTGAVLNLLQACADTDLSLLYESRNQLALALRPRVSLYNQAPRLTLDYGQGQLSGALNPVDDDAYTRNDITVARSGGSSVTAVQATGPLNIQSAPYGVGDYSTSVQLSLHADGDLADQAGWRLHLGTVDEPRYPTISLNLRHPQFTGSVDLLNAALSVDVGDRVRIVNPPAWLPPDGISLIAQGYSETLGVFEHDMVLNCSPESPWRVGLVEDAVLGHADTDGSTLAAAVSATAAQVQLATTNTGSPLWTTDPGDFPFDLAIGGEQMTVIGPGSPLGTDPFQAQGTAQYSGSNAALQYNTNNPWPRNADFLLASYVPATIKTLPTGGFASAGINGANSPAGSVTPGVSYTAWAWVYSTTHRPLQMVVNWALDGAAVSTSAGSPVIPLFGIWTLIQVTATAPGGVDMLSLGVQDPNSPTTSSVWWTWGVNAVATSALSQGSPQIFTVIRSVNGVVKAQVAGTDVRLFQPMTVSL